MIPGLIFCVVIGMIAAFLASLQSVMGAPILGLFLGIAATNLLPRKFVDKMSAGAGFSSKYLLKAGIILAGGTLSFSSIIGVGASALPIIIFNICLSFLTAWFIGRRLGVSGNTRILVGGGTAICGGTAIATLSPVIKAKEDEMAYAMTAIFLFDILAAILWPYAARAMHLSASQYGILGGLAISDTSSVTAAAATFDSIMGEGFTANIQGEALSGGDMAVIVKLTRTVMLIFVTIGVMVLRQLRGNGSPDTAETGGIIRRAIKSFPVFVLAFLIMALLNTLIGFSSVSLGAYKLSTMLSRAYKILIAIALVGVGCKIRLKTLFTDGLRPLLLGGFTWLALAVSTLCYALLFE